MTLDEAKKAMVKFVELKTTLRPAFVDPILNAEEVVRCKDCMYRDGNACDYSTVYVRPNGYCRWGERREDGTN